MKIRTIEELANHANHIIGSKKYTSVLLAKNEPVFHKMSHKELNEKLTRTVAEPDAPDSDNDEDLNV